MKLNILFLAAAAALSVAACKPADKPAESAAPAAEAAATEATAPVAETAPAVETAPVASTDGTIAVNTGVAECDDYLNKVYACISDKVPEAQRDMMKQGIEQSKASWAAVTDKAALAAQCKTAMDQAKASFGAMGCTF
jgi:hypothetical protein